MTNDLGGQQQQQQQPKVGAKRLFKCIKINLARFTLFASIGFKSHTIMFDMAGEKRLAKSNDNRFLFHLKFLMSK